MPGHLTTNGHRTSISVPAQPPAPAPARRAARRRDRAGAKPPLRGALVLGAADAAGLANELRTALAEARQGRHLEPAAAERRRAAARPSGIAIDYADGEDLVAKAELALRALQGDNPAAWTALRARGIFRGSRRAGQGRLPLHRPGLAVREHAGASCAGASRRRRALRRGRRDHGAAARGPAAVRHHLRRPGRPGRDGARRGGAAPHRDHPAGRADRRHRAHAPARRATGSRPTSSWATRSASTARSSPPARSRSRPRSRPSAPAGARWPASKLGDPGRDGRRHGAARPRSRRSSPRPTATSCWPTSTPPTRSSSAAPPRRSAAPSPR